MFKADVTPHCVDSATTLIRQGTERPDTIVRWDMAVSVAPDDAGGVHGARCSHPQRVQLVRGIARPGARPRRDAVLLELRRDAVRARCSGRCVPPVSRSFAWNDNWAGLTDYHFHMRVVVCAAVKVRAPRANRARRNSGCPATRPCASRRPANDLSSRRGYGRRSWRRRASGRRSSRGRGRRARRVPTARRRG